MIVHRRVMVPLSLTLTFFICWNLLDDLLNKTSICWLDSIWHHPRLMEYPKEYRLVVSDSFLDSWPLGLRVIWTSCSICVNYRYWSSLFVHQVAPYILMLAIMKFWLIILNSLRLASWSLIDRIRVSFFTVLSG